MIAQRIGFIGVGNMGESILREALAGQPLVPDDVRVTDARADWAQVVAKRHGVGTCASVPELVSQVDCILFAAKPQNLSAVLPEIDDAVRNGQWIISIAAGVPTSTWESGLRAAVPVVRVMPNIAASVGESMTAICGGRHAAGEHLAMAERLFDAVGRTIRVPEHLLDAVTGLSGSGPGFVFLVIEALADAGVQQGLTFEQARTLAAQTLLGAARMALESDEHPAALKTRVTSPGGTTAAGLAAMEEAAVRGAFGRAVAAATERSRELGDG